MKALFPQGNALVVLNNPSLGTIGEVRVTSVEELTTIFRECGIVQDYTNAGKVRRDVEGRVVLSTGAMVPEGNSLADGCASASTSGIAKTQDRLAPGAADA